MRGGYLENVNEILVDAAELLRELALLLLKGDALRPVVWRRGTPLRSGRVGCLVDEPSCEDLALVLLRRVQAAKTGRIIAAADKKIHALGPPLFHLLERARGRNKRFRGLCFLKMTFFLTATKELTGLLRG